MKPDSSRDREETDHQQLAVIENFVRVSVVLDEVFQAGCEDECRAWEEWDENSSGSFEENGFTYLLFLHRLKKSHESMGQIVLEVRFGLINLCKKLPLMVSKFVQISSEFQRYLVIEFCSRRVELCMSDYPTSVAPIMKYSGLRTIPACTCLANFTRSLACTIPDECLEMSTMIEREFEFGKVLDFLESFWFAGDQRFSWYGR
nr:hypothetical protein Iba_chr10aCG11460 [Ipomoea batatas]